MIKRNSWFHRYIFLYCRWYGSFCVNYFRSPARGVQEIALLLWSFLFQFRIIIKRSGLYTNPQILLQISYVITFNVCEISKLVSSIWPFNITSKAIWIVKTNCTRQNAIRSAFEKKAIWKFAMLLESDPELRRGEYIYLVSERLRLTIFKIVIALINWLLRSCILISTTNNK